MSVNHMHIMFRRGQLRGVAGQVQFTHCEMLKLQIRGLSGPSEAAKRAIPNKRIAAAPPIDRTEWSCPDKADPSPANFNAVDFECTVNNASADTVVAVPIDKANVAVAMHNGIPSRPSNEGQMTRATRTVATWPPSHSSQFDGFGELTIDPLNFAPCSKLGKRLS